MVWSFCLHLCTNKNAENLTPMAFPFRKIAMPAFYTMQSYCTPQHYTKPFKLMKVIKMVPPLWKGYLAVNIQVSPIGSRLAMRGCKNSFFPGMQGFNVKIDENGDAQGNFTLLARQKPVQNQSNADYLMIPTAYFVDATEDDELPVSCPRPELGSGLTIHVIGSVLLRQNESPLAKWQATFSRTKMRLP